MTLPADIARCDGVGSASEGWRDGCANCLRRTAPRPWPFCVGMQPPKVIVFECEYRIDPKERE